MNRRGGVLARTTSGNSRLGVLNHEGAQGALPAGFTTRDGDKDVFHTWASYTLPYLEAANVFDQIDFEKSSFEPWEEAGFTCPQQAKWVWTQLEVFLCPSDEPPGVHTGLVRVLRARKLPGKPWLVAVVAEGGSDVLRSSS